MCEGNKAIKINKFQHLTSRFESIRMADDEIFDEFYAKLNDIVNSAFNLGEVYDQPKIVRKILRSLTENFRPKVTTITESKDVDTILVDEFVGSFQFYESDLPKTNCERPQKGVLSKRDLVLKTPLFWRNCVESPLIFYTKK